MNLDNITLLSICGNSKFLLDTIKAAKICMRHINFKHVKILSNTKININDIEIIEIPSLNKEQYSEFVLYNLPSYINTDYCLAFQGDGFIINPQFWNDKFLNYDYIGAPWVSETINPVGNGGFSLRSQKFLHSAKTLKYNSKIQFQPHIRAGELVTPEDWFTCCYSYEEMKKMGILFADQDTAYEFSVEHPSMRKIYNRYDLTTYQSFGFHGSFNTAAMALLEQ